MIETQVLVSRSILKCDFCDAVRGPSSDKSLVRGWAKRQGWHHVVVMAPNHATGGHYEIDKDYCPTCWAKRKETC